MIDELDEILKCNEIITNEIEVEAYPDRTLLDNLKKQRDLIQSLKQQKIITNDNQINKLWEVINGLLVSIDALRKGASK